jgi:ferredoxin
VITEECVACGACEDECPTGAISLGDAIFVIDPSRCTECVGLHDSRRCAEACPVGCCIPEAVLLARAREITGGQVAA